LTSCFANLLTLRPEMALSSWLTGLAGAALGAAILCNLPTRLWMPAERATLKYLADTSLRTLDANKREFKASELWQTNGAVVMAVRRPG